MNTMDEVIKALECCELGSMYSMCESCPYTGIGNCNVEIQEDALHYLKKYREEYKALVKTINEAIDVEMKYYHMIEELERNSPLTWDEFCTMKGKPVWIEFLNDKGEWNGEWCLVESSNDILCEILRCKMTWWGLRKITLGKTWQAYQREKR